DGVSVNDVERMNPSAIVISPGPCTPNEAGISLDLIRQLGSKIPMLGVCLGHQALGAAFGAKIIRAPIPVHGRTSMIYHDQTELFAGVPNPLRATRYHSLVVDEETLPNDLKVTARLNDGLLMALQHRKWPLYGVQFHPESVLTQFGRKLLSNFLSIAGMPTSSLTVEDWSEPPPPETTEDGSYQCPVPW
ncbi:MAG: aminodeoxychorismate/anthranilate synthase component II, partial [Planctomycetes bacterium]|nr:aminodeoxychorismate/anthranilate synthase component II [Planctomycetota bacterium]